MEKSRLLLWDIDGTLILGGNAGSKALKNYFKKRYGKKVEPICYHCGTPNLSQAELEATNDPDLISQ